MEYLQELLNNKYINGTGGGGVGKWVDSIIGILRQGVFKGGDSGTYV